MCESLGSEPWCWRAGAVDIKGLETDLVLFPALKVFQGEDPAITICGECITTSCSLALKADLVSSDDAVLAVLRWGFPSYQYVL